MRGGSERCPELPVGMGREAGTHRERQRWLPAPGAARDGLAAFPRGFSRQERAQQDRGQLVPARHQYIPVCLETSLCATQTVSPKHFISTAGKAQIKAAAGSSGELPPPGCCPGSGNCPGRREGSRALTIFRWHHWQIPQRTMVTLRLTVMMAETRSTSREGVPGGTQRGGSDRNPGVRGDHGEGKHGERGPTGSNPFVQRPVGSSAAPGLPVRGVLGGIRPRALPRSSGRSFNPGWSPGSAGTAGKGRGCCFVSQSRTDSSQRAAQTCSSPARPRGQPWGPQKCGKDPSTSSSASAPVRTPSMRSDHCGVRIRTRGGSGGAQWDPKPAQLCLQAGPLPQHPRGCSAGMGLSVAGAPAGGGRRRGRSSAGSGAAV